MVLTACGRNPVPPTARFSPPAEVLVCGVHDIRQFIVGEVGESVLVHLWLDVLAKSEQRHVSVPDVAQRVAQATVVRHVWLVQTHLLTEQKQWAESRVAIFWQ